MPGRHMTWRFEVARGAVGLLGLILMLALGSPACSDDSPTAPSPSDPPPGAITEVPASLPPRTALETPSSITTPVSSMAGLPSRDRERGGLRELLGAGPPHLDLVPAGFGAARHLARRALYTSRDGAQVERQFDGAFSPRRRVSSAGCRADLAGHRRRGGPRALGSGAGSINADHAAFVAARGFRPSCGSTRHVSWRGRKWRIRGTGTA